MSHLYSTLDLEIKLMENILDKNVVMRRKGALDFRENKDGGGEVE